jgi:CheY-like chemotaxis protein
MDDVHGDPREFRSQSTTILIIEPDILVRMVIAEYLRGCGYKVIEGAAGEDFFTVLQAGTQIGIVFSEVRLSGRIDGFTLAKQIREAYPAVDVILTTGVAQAADKAGDLCEETPLKKPYHPSEVMRRINILRERQRTFDSQ